MANHVYVTCQKDGCGQHLSCNIPSEKVVDGGKHSVICDLCKSETAFTIAVELHAQSQKLANPTAASAA
ncbi:MAG: hypothetical protein HRT35_00850 [Algicola sp.]|nr:hypothetical protein [Algicola sp.]